MTIKFKAKEYSKVKELIKKGIKFNNKEKAKELNIGYRTMQRYVARAKNELGMTTLVIKKTSSKKRQGGGGIDGFRERFDDSMIIPKLIEEGIEKYLVSKNGEPDWMYDYDFRELCGISTTKWRRYADDFKYLQIKVQGQTVWGHPDIIEEMKEVLIR